jgi:hypothetical protein
MTALAQFIDNRLAQLPGGRGLQWPGGLVARWPGGPVAGPVRWVRPCACCASPGVGPAQAWQHKLDLARRKLQLASGQRFLDMGAGWGGLLLRAAQHDGVRTTGITLPRHQHAHGSRLIDATGLGGRVARQLLDDRRLQHSEGFDRIASLGMRLACAWHALGMRSAARSDHPCTRRHMPA